MYRELKHATLRTGEAVTAALIQGPDADWADRIERMLVHKGDPWTWQNSELLRQPTGIESRFYVLHRGGAPFANILLAETAGVALLAHVWTEPADRCTGASSILMELLLGDFRARQGRAIFLGTDFDTPPWHYYRRRGFEPVEPGSGYMESYPQPRADFDRAWFSATEAVIEPLGWQHWAASAPLFLGPFEGAVRLAGVQLVGRISSEGPLLPVIREERRRRAADEPVRACVLRDAAGPAVLGVACRRAHPFWPLTDVLDVYCHPAWWPRASDLLQAMPTPASQRTLAYVDTAHTAKRAVLEKSGFAPATTLAQWVTLPSAGPRVDVTVYAQG